MAEDGGNENVARSRRKPGHSMLGPMILITAGGLVLLYNLNRIPDPNWQAALRLWPLLLIFIGLNMIVRQVRRPFGTWLSLLVSLVCIAVFVHILFFADQSPAMGQLSGFLKIETTHETILYPSEEVVEADVRINFSAAGAQVFDLEDSRNMLEADISYLDKLIFETDVNQGKAEIILDTDDDGGWPYWFNPASWIDDEVDEQWQIALSQAVLLDLDLDLRSGSVRLDLDELNLTNLAVDGGAGSSHLLLPGGDYDMVYDVDSGAVEMTLPSEGQHNFSIDGGTGRLIVIIPRSLQTRLVIDEGSGRLRIDSDRLSQVELSDEDGGTWESNGYAAAADKVDLLIELGPGDVIIKDQE